jgi:hypothetical protein
MEHIHHGSRCYNHGAIINGNYLQLKVWRISSLFGSHKGEIVFYAASFTGSPSHSGRSIRGSINFQTGTKGKFSSVDDKVGVFELDFDVNQNYSLKIWEWN